ncbi:MAG: hypothetical protein WBA28_05995 [Microbacteriaceae bacterium]
MKFDIFIVLYIILMGALIITLDVLFLRDHFAARLGTNIGIVLVFGAVYFLFLRKIFK